jgi:hypothetical protein
MVHIPLTELVCEATIDIYTSMEATHLRNKLRHDANIFNVTRKGNKCASFAVNSADTKTRNVYSLLLQDYFVTVKRTDQSYGSGFRSATIIDNKNWQPKVSLVCQLSPDGKVTLKHANG